MHNTSQSSPSSRSLGEIDWLLRRRSLNAVGELDYALSMAHNAQRNSAANGGSAYPPSVHPTSGNHDTPSVLIIAAYALAQIGFLGLNVITLVALWKHAPRAAFIVFLVWVVVFYALLALVPQRLEVERHILSMISRRKRGQPNVPPPVPSSPTPPPNSSHGPYLHTPSFTRTMPADMSSGRRRSAEDDDDDIDEDTRQRMIEAEMDRREVSIITMPKRKLWVANPS
ncbi:hypothetical protein EST38_g643 [Candolleomyces aberdarensis]|uniref:Uncharacterized protein n=1 Tax=Candolleomyces aberdarensis TaxID=2316362 RepID=A0A4Q2E1K7_9AGAR|nr:hypothetical protein EST38_g643 [Candolleomyces aberdarensis]